MLKRALFVMSVWAWTIVEAHAQMPSHRPSENFKPHQKDRRTVVSAEAQDGELTLEEYHRRRLIHEKKPVPGSADRQGTLDQLDREIQSAFMALTNPFSSSERAKSDQSANSQSSAFEKEVKLRAELDRQIERSKAEEQRWNVMAVADFDQDYEDYQQAQKSVQNQLQNIQQINQVSPEQIRELLRSMPKAEGDSEMPQEYQKTLAETLFLVLSPLRQMPREEFKATLTKALENKPVLNQLGPNHVALEIFTDLVRDPKALPNLGLITHDKKTLFKFILANIALFFFAYQWKRKQKKTFKAMVSRLMTVSALRLSILIFFYGSLLSAGFTIMKGHLF